MTTDRFSTTASRIRDLFLALRQEGFSDDQALALTAAAVREGHHGV